MKIRVKLTSERPEQAERELADHAGFPPRHEDDSLLWEFYSRECGTLFLIAAGPTPGVATAKEA